MSLERKYIEIKSEEVKDSGEFIGIASFYGNVDLGGDIVMKGAFESSLEESKEVVMLWQHKQDTPIGIFTLEDTNEGLKAHGKINMDVEKGKEAHALLKQGAIKGLSIGFITKDSEWKGDNRVLKELDLKEISVVTFPMNTAAEVDLATVKSENLEGQETSVTEVGIIIKQDSDYVIEFIENEGKFYKVCEEGRKEVTLSFEEIVTEEEKAFEAELESARQILNNLLLQEKIKEVKNYLKSEGI